MNPLKLFAVLCCMLLSHAYTYAQEHRSEPVTTLTVVKIPAAPEIEQASHTKQLYLKTNLIGWGLTMANLAIEVDFAKHWSAQLPVYYSGMDYFIDNVSFRTLSIQPEIRYWFSDDANDKLFIGAHFGLTHYNFAFNGEYRYQDKNGNTPAMGGGISIGYRMPLCKNGRWKMEFSIGGGVYPTQYDKFLNIENGAYAESDEKTYIGLDHAAISFAYMFNLNKKSK